MNVPTKINQMMQLVMSAFESKVRIGPVAVPAASHSIRVMLNLLTRTCVPEVALGGGGHDLLEDTFVTYNHIVQVFGQRVGDLVQACTIDPKLGDTPEGEAELYERNVRIAESGDCASLIIKCEDSYDNLKTNRHLKPEWQIGQFRRGMLWLSALTRSGIKQFIPDDLLEDLGMVLGREERRLKKICLI